MTALALALAYAGRAVAHQRLHDRPRQQGTDMTDFKPGDVAMVSRKGSWIKATRYDTESEQGWQAVVGVAYTYFEEDPGTQPRRLVVIDPEDREDVERLTVLLSNSGAFPNADVLLMQTDARFITAALREFATPTPPRPDEPTGLGAVVEDADGKWWIHFESKTGWWWRDAAGRNSRWHEIDAVRVLSEGVTP